MKKRNRSRSRSRSHSPFHNREKKYPRAYQQQNNREFRGYHRGFRRPYNFRGRGRGQFPRGRYQRGGGGYNNNNNNYRPNWKNYKQYPQKYQQWQQYPQQQQQQFNFPQGRPHNNLQNRSGTPPQGQSHRSDRSSSPVSRHSHHSSSSSHSSPPKARPATVPAQTSEDVKDEQLTSKQVQKVGEEDEEPEEPSVELLEENPADGAGSGKSDGKKNCLGTGSVAQNSHSPGQTSNTKVSNDTSNGAPVWQSAGGSCSTRKASHEGLNPMLSSFDFFSTEEFQEEDKKAISIAFRKFLEEQSKKANSAVENSKTEAEDGGLEKGKVNGKTSATVSDSASEKCREKTKGDVSLNSFLKTSPFLSAEGEEEDDEILNRPSLKFLFKDLHNGDESCKPKISVSHSGQKPFGECFRKQNAAYSQFTNGEFNSTVEERWAERKQDKAIAAVLAKRELTEKFEDLSPEMSFKTKMMAGSPSALSSAAARSGSSNREMFMMREQDTTAVSSRKQEAKFHVRMGFLGDNLISSSDILAEERQLSQDLVLSSKKDPEFRSIFQHVQNAQSQRSPSELFAQHIVTIVHHVKTQHFPSSGLTLNERFTLYQREAAEQETKKSRKSPEIHRRIDVSPSAFKKPPQLFGGAKSSEEGTYKSAGEKVKGDAMDLRLDIERRKKYSCFQNQNQEIDVGDSPDFSSELCEQNLSKYCNKSNDQKRRRSSSSSSSSSSKSQKLETQDKSELKDEEFHKTKPCQRESTVPAQGGRPLGDFQIQICGRSWNKSSFQENTSYSSSMNSAHPESKGWDPEFTPKNRKYYLHDDRDEESKWTDKREPGQGNQSLGRARFIIRKATGGASKTSLKWPFEKFQANGDTSGKKGEEADQDHREEEK
ncbi:thyroid hormone receptor-associated protein 3 isoform X2 [Oryzias melastigma]|uniref:Thyroid hormone receptor associated protein 3a n=1 Tax=Oryzias melastigma TaxID=30732 RepID=A0A3B3CIF8_ORYME|nr:thyroid hormone receptor-associated protein 3 isoform X2 [Oryzias melastigma]